MNFETFYINWYSRVKSFALGYVQSEEEAENIAQDVFMDFYERDILSDTSINTTSYLFTSVKNRCLNYLKHRVIEQSAAIRMQNEFEMSLRLQFDTLSILDTEIIDEHSLEIIVQQALNSLPERCRDIFIMNKFEGKKQKEIADELNISINTVESQMAIAYKKLKIALQKYALLLALFNAF